MNKFNVKSFYILGLVSVFLTLASTTHAAQRTSTLSTLKGTGGVDVISYVRSDKRALFLDFENFPKNVDHIYYNINYDQKDASVKGGIEGHFFPQTLAYSGEYNGKKYIRREFIFGTCSKNDCVYHKPKNVTVTVRTNVKGAKVVEYTKVLSIPDSQF